MARSDCENAPKAANKAQWKLEWNSEWHVEVPTCSNCGRTPANWLKSEYCPNCGALMDVKVPTKRVHEEAPMPRMIDADKLIDQIKLKYGMYPIYFVDDKTPWGRQAEIDTALIDLLEQAASKSVSCANCKYGKEIHTGCARAIMCTNDDVPFIDENGELYVDFDWSCPLGERRQDNGKIH